MRYVYLIGDYDEHGSRNLRATLDRSKVKSLLDVEGFDAQDKGEAREKLAALLVESDDTLIADSGHNLMDGWGGPQLFVVRLEE